MPGLISKPKMAIALFLAFAAFMSAIAMSGSKADAIGLGPAGWYAFGDSSCSEGSRSDPIGVLFRGKSASAHNVAEQVKIHPDWNYDVQKNQYLWVLQNGGTYDCREANESVAESPDSLPTSRYHVRLWFIPAPKGSLELKTIGTPHHEDWVAFNPANNHCEGAVGVGSHAVDKGGVGQGLESGFDRGRHKLKSSFEASGHPITSENWGNTKEFEQCDKDWAGSDGWGLNIWIIHSMSPHTSSASAIKTTGSTLNGKLVTEEASTEWWFGYGTSPSQGAGGYPNKTPVRTTSGSAEVDVSEAVSSLSPNTTYYFRLFARNSKGEMDEGSELSYRTVANIPPEDDDLGGAHSIVQSNGTIDVFYRTPTGGLGHNAYVNGSWGQPAVPGSLASDPHAIAQNNGTVDVFYKTPTGGLGHTVYLNGAWSLAPLPGSVEGDPYPIVQSNGTIDVFYRTPTGGLGHNAYVNGSWGQPALTGSLAPTSDPHPVVQSNGTIDVFYRTPTGGLGHNAYVNGTWSQNVLPGSLASDPHPVVQPNGTIDVFYRTPEGGLGHTVYVEGGWSLAPLPGSVSGEPNAVVQPNGTIDVFYRTPSSGLGHNAYVNGHWGQPELPGSLDPREGMGVHALAQANGIIDAFYRTPSGGLGHNAYANGFWGQEVLPGEVSSNIPADLEAMPVTEPFDGSSKSLTSFENDFSKLGWVVGKGQSTSTGWGPVTAFATGPDGIYRGTSLTDGGSGLAAVATLNVSPGSENRYFSLWLDMATPGGSRNGYELRFTYVSSNTYNVKLCKWEGGIQKELASQSGYSLSTGSAVALVDEGSTISAWTNSGPGFEKKLGATDSAYSGGYPGLESGGNFTRLKNLKTGEL